MSSYTSTEDEGFFAAIGRLTLSWGMLELGLDSMIFFIHHGLGNNQYEKEVPRALSRKLKYLRKAFARLNLGNEIEQSFAKLFDKIESASETRHDIIHGSVVEHSEGTGEAKLIRLLHRKTHWETRDVSVTTRSILVAASETQRLAGITLRFANVLEEMLSDTGKPPGEVD